MKLSIVVSTQPASFEALAYKGQLIENIIKIARLGYDGVELAVRNPEQLNVHEIQNLLTDYKLHVPAIGTGQLFGEEGLSLTSTDERIRQTAIERLKSHIELAAQLNAIIIIGLVRGKIERSIEESLELFKTSLLELLQYGEQFKVNFAIEPINRYETNLINTVKEGLEFVEKIGKNNLGLLLDTFHMNIEEPSITESIKLVNKKLFHFHVADSNRWYPGAGHIDFKQILSALETINYDGYLSAEILPLPDPETSAQQTISNIKALIF